MIRKLKTKLLVWKAILYRLLISIFEVIVLYALTGNIMLSIGTSLILNIINIAFYFVYDYVFLQHFKIGVNGDKK